LHLSFHLGTLYPFRAENARERIRYLHLLSEKAARLAVPDAALGKFMTGFA
jgi:hypothetical protein